MVLNMFPLNLVFVIEMVVTLLFFTYICSILKNVHYVVKVDEMQSVVSFSSFYTPLRTARISGLKS